MHGRPPLGIYGSGFKHLGPHLRTRCSPFFGPTPKSGDVSAFIIVTVDFELELGTLKSHGRSVAGVHSFVLS